LPHLNCLTSIKAPEKSSTSSTPYKPDPAVTSANTFSAKMISSYHGFKASGHKIMTLNPETTTVMKQLVTIHPLPSSGPPKKSGSN